MTKMSQKKIYRNCDSRKWLLPCPALPDLAGWRTYSPAFIHSPTWYASTQSFHHLKHYCLVLGTLLRVAGGQAALHPFMHSFDQPCIFYLMNLVLTQLFIHSCESLLPCPGRTALGCWGAGNPAFIWSFILSPM